MFPLKLTLPCQEYILAYTQLYNVYNNKSRYTAFYKADITGICLMFYESIDTSLKYSFLFILKRRLSCRKLGNRHPER